MPLTPKGRAKVGAAAPIHSVPLTDLMTYKAAKRMEYIGICALEGENQGGKNGLSEALRQIFHSSGNLQARHET